MTGLAQPDRPGEHRADDGSGPGGSGPGNHRPAASPPARRALARFAADPRMPIWLRRGIVCVVAGVVIGIWVDWRLGLTAAAVIAILDTIHRSRTTAVLPATVRLTSAQRRTRRRLRRRHPNRLPHPEHPGLPGSPELIDHLLIGPAGVFAVDSELWDRRLPIRTTQGGGLYHGPFNQTNRLQHARWEASQASRLISLELGRELQVQPAMAIYGPTVPWTVVEIAGVDVFGGRRLASTSAPGPGPAGGSGWTRPRSSASRRPPQALSPPGSRW